MSSAFKHYCGALLAVISSVGLWPVIAVASTGLSLFIPPGSGPLEQNVAKMVSVGRIDQALQELRRLTEASQKEDLRCRAFILKSQIDEARDDTDSAAADIEAAWKTGKMDKFEISWTVRRAHHYCSGPIMLQLCNKMAEDSNQCEAGYAHFVKARMAANADRYAESMKEYELSMKLDPSAPAAFQEGGSMYSRLGRNDEAVKALTHALELVKGIKNNSKQMIGILEARARANLLLKKYPQSLADYNDAIKRAPLIRELFIGRAEVFKAMGERAKSQADLDHVKSIDEGY